MLAISFISAGLITLVGGIGVIYGANLGTTTGAWLIAGLGLKINISAYAMPMLIFGILLSLRSSRTQQGIGYVLTGVGFLFLGIHYMKEGFESLRQVIDLTQFAIEGTPGLLLYTGLGILATVIMQSSHASLVLTITALSAGQVGYENALALAIGSNVGTTVSAVIGALGANIQGRRLAAAHVIFNVVTGAVAIVFIEQLLAAVEFISSRTAISAENYTLKLAVFHSLFNTLGLVLMLPFTKPLADWLPRALPVPVAGMGRPA